MAETTRSQTQFYLLGDSISELKGSKFSFLRKVLGFFFHQHFEMKETIKQASSSIITGIATF